MRRSGATRVPLIRPARTEDFQSFAALDSINDTCVAGGFADPLYATLDEIRDRIRDEFRTSGPASPENMQLALELMRGLGDLEHGMRGGVCSPKRDLPMGGWQFFKKRLSGRGSKLILKVLLLVL